MLGYGLHWSPESVLEMETEERLAHVKRLIEQKQREREAIENKQ